MGLSVGVPGARVAPRVGEALGDAGPCDGGPDGDHEGSKVGLSVGVPGTRVALRVGEALGDAGAWDGDREGAREGLSVGFPSRRVVCAVGAIEGAVDGDVLGAGLNLCSHLSPE
jgi:hypothetical protein